VVLIQKKICPGESRGFCCFTGVFEGCFGKTWCLVVVNCGDDRGGLLVRAWCFAVTILESKNTPGFLDLFLGWRWIWGGGDWRALVEGDLPLAVDVRPDGGAPGLACWFSGGIESCGFVGCEDHVGG